MKTYEIRTLADIYNLPTMEAMETCLDELKASMVQVRAIIDRLNHDDKGTKHLSEDYLMVFPHEGDGKTERMESSLRAG